MLRGLILLQPLSDTITFFLFYLNVWESSFFLNNQVNNQFCFCMGLVGLLVSTRTHQSNPIHICLLCFLSSVSRNERERDKEKKNRRERAEKNMGRQGVGAAAAAGGDGVAQHDGVAPPLADRGLFTCPLKEGIEVRGRPRSSTPEEGEIPQMCGRVV